MLTSHMKASFQGLFPEGGRGMGEWEGGSRGKRKEGRGAGERAVIFRQMGGRALTDGQMRWDATTAQKNKGRPSWLRPWKGHPAKRKALFLDSFLQPLTYAPCMCFLPSALFGAFKCRLRKMPFENGLLYSCLFM